MGCLWSINKWAEINPVGVSSTGTLKQVCDACLASPARQKKAPGTKTECQHQPKGSSTISAELILQFLKDFSDYSAGQFDFLVIAKKMHLLLCTRPGALAALEWSWVNE